MYLFRNRGSIFEFSASLLYFDVAVLFSSFKEAFNMPYTTISKEIVCEQMLPLYPFESSPPSTFGSVPTSISFYWVCVLQY